MAVPGGQAGDAGYPTSALTASPTWPARCCARCSAPASTRPADLAKVLEAQGFSLEDFERFVSHYLGVQEMVATLGASGKLVTPDEIKKFVRARTPGLGHRCPVLQRLELHGQSDGYPRCRATVDTNELANYRIPERVQVSYIEFSVSNFLVKPNRSWPRPTSMISWRPITNGLAPTSSGTRNRLRRRKRGFGEEIIRDQALSDARKKANEFARPVFNVAQPSVDSLMAAAKAAGLTAQVTEPFTREAGPKGLEVNEDFTKSAFTLTPQDPMAGPFRGHDGIYIIAFHKRLPSEVPSLDQIRERVVADYRYEQAKGLARQSGLSFYSTLTNGLAQGRTFASLCAEAGLKPLTLSPFSISTRSVPELDESVSLNLIKQMAFTTSPGKASGFQWTAEGGVVLFVKSKLPINEARMNTDLPAFASGLRQQRQQEAFQIWFQQEYTRNVRALLAQPQQQPPPNLAARGAKKS